LKNLLQTHSASWAQSVKLTLQSEGIEAVVLDENAPGYMGFAGRIRVAVLNDAELPRAQSVLSGMVPPPSPPPPSWRLQKRGLQLLGLGFVLMFVTGGLFDRFEAGALSLASLGLTALAFVGGFLLIALGWRADEDRTPQ
jgi:Putative prokaryotic signal transducing protein